MFNYKKNIKILYIIILIFFIQILYISDAKAEATVPSGFNHAYEDNGMILYTYISDCPVVKANEGKWNTRSTFQKPRGIILSKDATNIDTTYIHFHGKNFTMAKDKPGSEGGTKEKTTVQTEEQLNSLFATGTNPAYILSKHAKAIKDSGKNAVIFFPRLYQSGKSNQHFTTGEFNCFYDEAKKKIKSIPNITYTETEPIVSGHSAGGNTIRNYLENGLTAQAALLYDACYGNWCKRAVTTGKAQKYFIYYTTQNDNRTKKDSTAAFNKNRSIVKLVETNYGHPKVLRNCFSDHLDGSLCGGGKLIGGGGTIDDTSSTGPSTHTTSISSKTKVMTADEVKNIIKIPQPKINIPGLDFSKMDVQSMATKDDDGNVYLNIPFLGDYISVVYRYSLVIISVIAIIIIMISGISWIISGGSTDKIQSAKKKLILAITGLIISSTSYLLLYTINPELVNFKSLQILYIKGISYTPNYIESPKSGYEETTSPASFTFKGGTGNLPSTGKGGGCLMNTFAHNKSIGQKLDRKDKKKIPFLGMKKNIVVNNLVVDIYKKVSDEILSSTDPEIIEFLKWMHDVEDGNSTSLNGAKNSAAVLSYKLRTIGWKTDAHALGLAIDIMTHSNWDVYLPGYKRIQEKRGRKVRGDPADRWCASYRKGLKKIRGKYPLLAKRMDIILKNCETFDSGKMPPYSIPMGMIKIFEKNGFYWGGWGWTRKGKPILRSDPMHFQYMGACK